MGGVFSTHTPPLTQRGFTQHLTMARLPTLFDIQTEEACSGSVVWGKWWGRCWPQRSCCSNLGGWRFLQPAEAVMTRDYSC